MKSCLTIIAVAILLSMIGCMALMACGSGKAPVKKEVPATRVQTDTARLQPVVYFDDYPGSIIALNQVVLTPQVTGYITGIHFRDGQYVNRGQLLYSLDQQQYQANVLAANANYRVAQSNLQMAQQDADRYLFLQENDAIASQVVDHSLSALQAAKMQLEAAEAAIQNARTGLRYTTIYAPLSGTIGISQVKPGASVSPGVTMLNTISADNPIAVDFNVDEKDLGRFEQLDRTTTGIADSTFTIALPDGNSYPFSGKVLLVDRSVDPQTATIVTRLEFSNPSDKLKTGMSCIVRVRNRKGQPELVIPAAAVTEQLGEYYVFVVNNNKVTRQKISTGRTVGYYIIVSDGIKPGDIVVTAGTAKLKNGTTVLITPKSIQQDL